MGKVETRAVWRREYFNGGSVVGQVKEHVTNTNQIIHEMRAALTDVSGTFAAVASPFCLAPCFSTSLPLTLNHVLSLKAYWTSR